MTDAVRSPVPMRVVRRRPAEPAFTLDLADDLARFERDWRELERRTVVTPYQRFDFIDAWCLHLAPGEAILPRIGVIRDRAGRPMMILPFGVRREGFATIALYLGGSDVNLAMPLVEPRFVRQQGMHGLREVLRRYCEDAGADLLALRDQPERWMGVPHPFLTLPH